MHNTKKALLLVLSFFILFNIVNAEEERTKGPIERGDVITVEGEPGNWTVKDTTIDKSCNINSPNEPVPIELADSEYIDSIGYTYENTCVKIGSKSESWCSEADSEGKCDNDTTASINVKSRDDMRTTFINMLPNKKSVGINIKKLSGIIITKGDPKFHIPSTDPNGPSPNGTGSTTCGGFIDYYKNVTLAIKWNCVWKEPYDCSYDNEEHHYVRKTCYKSKSEHHFEEESHGGELEDCSVTVPDNYKYLAREKGTCAKGNVADYEVKVSSASGPVRKFKGSTSVIYCDKVEPTKVEVFTYRLTIHGKNMDKEAYCINPSFDYNSSYTWDTTFNSSKCVDSLHSYDEDGNLIFDMECGYVYIIAEAKRINADLGKEVFTYPVISTAMRLFGTGITTKNERLPLPEEMSLSGYLQSAGYYTKYAGWGEGEYVGIPGIVPEKPSDWPAIYRYWMPKFYSIYINTANVAESYLKRNIRYSDVGNIPCTDSSKQMCIENSDGKMYITDANYYLEHKECKETFKNCNSNAVDLKYNDLDRLNSVPYVKGYGIQEFWTNDVGQESTCTDESGLGVLCGLEHEKVTKGGEIPDSDYIDAIYLYIRALQGNKILYEKKIQDAIDRYKPIEGLTRLIYNGEGEETGYAIRYTIDTQTTYENANVDCDSDDDECQALIYVYDSKGKLIQKNDSYDYCVKNYCYVEIKKQKICTSDTTSKTLKSVVVTDLDLKANLIKKIGNGHDNEQILYVYDDTASISGGFCEDIVAVQDNIVVNCPCNAGEKANNVIADGDIESSNSCKTNYNDFDELYYGDPSMSTILNACYNEDKIKYDFTEDLNANGNDLVHEGEQPVSKYSYQIDSTDYKFCTLYCRDESRLYLANKITVRSGMHLKYDVGGKLIDKRIINQTVNQKNKESYKYMPSVVLQYRECTSLFNYDNWKSQYNKANTEKEKNQLIYAAYNCNLYTTNEIVEAINKGEINDILGLNDKKYVNKTDTIYKYGNSMNKNNIYAEPAMIEYAYSIDDGKVRVINDWGTTKDYLLKQEACTSMGKTSGTECANYNITNYSDNYLTSLGIQINYEHGLVNSNLNNTIYCNGNSCYKLKDENGNYVYNPNYKGENDYTTVDAHDGHTESGKILSYNDWALKYNEYGKNSDKFKAATIDGNKIPINNYSSFMVVTETGFYNDRSYYADSYSGIITTESSNDNNKILLDRNIYPLHLNKDTGEYIIVSNFTNVRTAYKRSTYYKEKNYSLTENIKFATNALPSTFQYVCYYDLYNETGSTPKNKGAIGVIYRSVDLENVFASVTEDGSKSGRTREYPENWSTSIAQSTLNEVENSASRIMEPENDGDADYSYLEYSYTLTKQGIKKIRKYNYDQKSNGGYLNDTIKECEYDEKEGIFFNCNSSFLELIAQPTSEYYGDDLIIINKDNGASEFCSSNYNINEEYCKYQKKATLTAGGNN